MIVQLITVILCFVFAFILFLFLLKQYRIRKVLKKYLNEWDLDKHHLIHMEKEIPMMRDPVYHLKDKLECSLEPDEKESDELLKKFDSLKRQILPNDPILASLIAENIVRCEQKGISIRYRIGIPDTFEMQIDDIFFMYSIMLNYAYHIASDNTEINQESKILRIRSDSQFGIWHLHMECTHSSSMPNLHLKDKEALKVLQKTTIRNEKIGNDFIMLQYILKKYKLNLNYEIKNDLLELDIMS